MCAGCNYAMICSSNDGCPYCRTALNELDDVYVQNLEKRAKANDAIALFHLGCCYEYGNKGLSRDYAKGNELYLKAAELGHSTACYRLGHAYNVGRGVQQNKRRRQYIIGN
jgi:TPR repeat protein